MEINTLDLIIICGISLSIIISLFRGLIKEIFSLLSVIIGIFIAARYYPVTAKLLSGMFENQNWASIAGFILTLILVSFVIGLIGMIVQKLIKVSNLSIIDRLGGALFGFIKGVFITFCILMLLVTFFPPQTHFLKTSKVTPQIIKISTMVIYLIPADLKDRFKGQLVQFKDIWAKNINGGDPPQDNSGANTPVPNAQHPDDSPQEPKPTENSVESHRGIEQ